VIGRRSEDGFALKVAHIFPYALANNDACRELDFWRVLELFYGLHITNRIFNAIRWNVNCLANLITLDNSVHFMFDNGRLTLTPETTEGVGIPILNNHRTDYMSRVRYPMGMSTPHLIQSTRIYLHQNSAQSLFHNSRIPVVCPDRVRPPFLHVVRQMCLTLLREWEG